MLNLDRTPWHMTWVGVRPQRARRRLDRARVSARSLPVERSWSFRRRAPRHGCQPCLRGSRLSSRVPPALSLSASRLGWRHALDEGSPADGNVSRAGDECGGVGVGTERRFDEARLAGAPHESVQTCHTPLASEVGRRPWRDPQEMPLLAALSRGMYGHAAGLHQPHRQRFRHVLWASGTHPGTIWPIYDSDDLL